MGIWNAMIVHYTYLYVCITDDNLYLRRKLFVSLFLLLMKRGNITEIIERYRNLFLHNEFN